ncbi:MAG: GldG family protein [Oscillospiraceae bacterium]|nr:GldG family protein [Ruminococcus sp.]MDE6706839.1 GldG family protein [Oscillospiraceae bacterium]
MEQQEKNFKNLKNRKFTAYAIILVALALAIAIPINLLASRLNIIWDMTPAKLYELSDTTKNYLETLDKQVDFYFLMDMDYLATDDNSMALYYSLKQYSEYENINFIDFDTDTHPELVAQLKEDGYNLSVGDMVFHCEGRTKHVAGVNMYQYEVSYDDDNNRTVEAAYFRGENYITGAINAVATGREASVYFLSGHGEKTIENDYTTFYKNMKNINYNAQELNLATLNEVPEDATMIIVAAPKSDFTNDETRMINHYLENGGNICFLMSPNEEEIAYKNIESIMNSFGIGMDYDIVSETDTSLYVSGDPYTYRVSIVRNEDTDVDLTSEIADMTDNGYYAFMSDSRSFYQYLGAEDTSLEIGSLLQTVSTTDSYGYETSSAIGEPYGGTDAMAETLEGYALDLAMYSVSSSRNNAKMFVMGNAEFIDDVNVSQDYMIIPVYLMLSNMTWMYNSDLVLDMGIADKERNYDSMTINSESSANTTMILFIAVPVIVGLIGAGVWLKRRYS